MGRIVIMAVKPHPGKKEELKKTLEAYVPKLKEEGLATNRKPVMAETNNGIFIEVLEWLSEEVKTLASKNNTVLKLHAQFYDVSEVIKLNELDESKNLFAEFKTINQFSHNINPDGMGRIVIVAYKPKPGKAEALKELTKIHVPRLRVEHLVTDRQAVIMEAADGTVIEVFEWLSADAIRQAHANPVVHQLWAEYAEVCDYVNLNSLAEAGNMFAEFNAVD